MELLGFFLFLSVAAMLFALLEIQIEGKHGWAEDLPTWKRRNPLHDLIPWPRYLTGYHLYFWSFIFVLMHFAYFLSAPLNLKNEIAVLEAYSFLLLLEDFLWFVLNPRWGLKKFLTHDAPWHTHKIFYVPKVYWLAFPLIITLETLRRIV